MSYWIHLQKDGNAVDVDAHSEGGTYALGGTQEAELNVTYNYSECYRLVDFSLRDLDEKRAGDTIEKLQAIVEKLGTLKFENYWAPTPGNAGHAANILLGWAKQHPDAIWHVS